MKEYNEANQMNNSYLSLRYIPPQFANGFSTNIKV